jgi:outer membrane protein assembly factor BamE (lipoprotein component of BamABCDE complex)
MRKRNIKGDSMKRLSIVVIILALLSACSSLGIQGNPSIASITITENQMEQIEQGMTYDQISSILGSPGKMEALPKLLLSWSQDGCYLQVMIKEDKEAGYGSWCDQVRKEIAGETYYKEVSDPFSNKIKSGMTYQEIIKAIGEPHRQQEVFVYRWQGVDGPRKNEITVEIVENIAVNIFKFSLEEK